MSQAELSRITGIRAATINEIYHEMAERISFEHLDKICEALDCSLHNLIEYVPSKRRKTGNNLIVEYHGNRKKKPQKNRRKNTV